MTPEQAKNRVRAIEMLTLFPHDEHEADQAVDLANAAIKKRDARQAEIIRLMAEAGVEHVKMWDRHNIQQDVYVLEISAIRGAYLKRIEVPSIYDLTRAAANTIRSEAASEAQDTADAKQAQASHEEQEAIYGRQPEATPEAMASNFDLHDPDFGERNGSTRLALNGVDS